MLHFTPTFGIRETAKNARGFVSEHMNIFWSVLKPLLPYIIALHLFDLIVSLSTGVQEFALGSLLSTYFYAALIISWHRVVLDGPERYTPMNPLKPRKHELMFMGAFALLSILPLIFIISTTFIFSLSEKKELIAIGAIASFMISMYVVLRLSFLLPAIALNTPLTLRQCFIMTHGYLIKMIFSSILASVRLIGLVLLYVVTVGILMAITVGKSQEAHAAIQILNFLLNLPIIAYFQPLLTVIGVTVVSNYYQYEMQNEQSGRLAS